MAQWLRMHAALTEEFQVRFPVPMLGSSLPPVTLAEGNSVALFLALRARTCCVYPTLCQTHLHILKGLKIKSRKST